MDLVCRDVSRSIAFYLDVFGALGLQPPVTFPGERGEQIHYLRFPGRAGSLGLRQASGPEKDQEFELYAPGFHHVALGVDERAEVEQTHDAAVRAGAQVLHPPRAFPDYDPNYYATFFLDPDGFRVEVRSLSPV
jgi:catechol 2,3-dioxygenase-like lactoylglutathione lyase family enzyme